MRIGIGGVPAGSGGGLQGPFDGEAGVDSSETVARGPARCVRAH